MELSFNESRAVEVESVQFISPGVAVQHGVAKLIAADGEVDDARVVLTDPRNAARAIRAVKDNFTVPDLAVLISW